VKPESFHAANYRCKLPGANYKKGVDKENRQVYNIERKGNGVFEGKCSKTPFFCCCSGAFAAQNPASDSFSQSKIRNGKGEE
jgi:hypothetical protein